MKGRRYGKVLAVLICAAAAGVAGPRADTVESLGDFAGYPVCTLSWSGQLPAKTPGSGPAKIFGILGTPQGSRTVQWNLGEPKAGGARAGTGGEAAPAGTEGNAASVVQASLAALVPAGGAECPPMEMRLRPVIFADGTSLLLQDFPAQTNSGDPFRVVSVARVWTAELFSPLVAAGMGFPRARQISPEFLRNLAPPRLKRTPAIPQDRFLVRLKGLLMAVVPLFTDKDGYALLFIEGRDIVNSIKVDYLKYIAKTTQKKYMSALGMIR